MQLPLVGVPALIKDGLEPYREVFCREAGFEHVSRYVPGRLLKPNKTLHGIYAQQGWPDEPGVSRRARHAAVFAAGWDSEALLPRQRAVVAADHRGRGLEVIGLEGTSVHHARGPTLYATKRAYDHVEGRMSTDQTLVTAVVANAEGIAGVAVEVQCPNYQPEELAYLQMTAPGDDTDLESARQRFIDWLPYPKNRLSYRKRTEIAVEIARQLDAEGQFPHAHSAFANGGLALPLTQLSEQQGNHWVSELEGSWHLQWQGQWRRVDEGDAELGQQPPDSVRPLKVSLRNRAETTFWVVTKPGRLKRYGRKRLVIVHEPADLQDQPRLLLTDALPWESARVIRVWSYAHPVEIVPECCQPTVGLEAAQVRTAEAVTRHFRWSCVAQSLLQRTPGGGKTSERFAFAGQYQPTVGQNLDTLTREALGQLLQLVQRLFCQGQSHAHILERLMPA